MKKPTPKGNPGRMAGPMKEQKRVRSKMESKARALADGLRNSETSTWRYKDKKTGKIHGWQADSVYRQKGIKEVRARTDNYVKSNRATGKPAAKKGK